MRKSSIFHANKSKQLKNIIKKKILTRPFYDILFIPYYRNKFEYHARFWYEFDTENLQSTQRSFNND